MSEALIVEFEHKSYTWDGKRWYGTADYVMPPRGMIHRLNELLPKEEPAPKAKRAVSPRP